LITIETKPEIEIIEDTEKNIEIIPPVKKKTTRKKKTLEIDIIDEK
jgi:hypothetical protein